MLTLWAKVANSTTVAMFNKQMLKAMINERLSETAEEIFLLFEQAVAEYQREIDYWKNLSEAKRTIAETVSSQQPQILAQEKLPRADEKSAKSLQCEVKTEQQEDRRQVCVIHVNNVSSADELERLQQQTTSEEGAESSCGSNEDDSDTDNDSEEPLGPDASKKSFSCSVCQELFPRRRDLKVHMTSVHQNQESNISTTEQDDEQNLGTLQDSPSALTGIFSCKVCDKQFKLQSSMKKHMKTHAEDDPFKCTDCSVTFTKEAHYIRHMKMVHSVEKPFKCSFCHKCVKTSQILRAHILVHTGERPFKCSVCGKGFVQKGHLRSHMFTHTGQFHGHLAPQNDENVDQITIE